MACILYHVQPTDRLTDSRLPRDPLAPSRGSVDSLDLSAGGKADDAPPTTTTTTTAPGGGAGGAPVSPELPGDLVSLSSSVITARTFPDNAYPGLVSANNSVAAPATEPQPYAPHGGPASLLKGTKSLSLGQLDR
jgi:hypothetical protein